MLSGSLDFRLRRQEVLTVYSRPLAPQLSWHPLSLRFPQVLSSLLSLLLCFVSFLLFPSNGLTFWDCLEARWRFRENWRGGGGGKKRESGALCGGIRLQPLTRIWARINSSLRPFTFPRLSWKLPGTTLTEKGPVLTLLGNLICFWFHLIIFPSKAPLELPIISITLTKGRGVGISWHQYEM